MSHYLIMVGQGARIGQRETTKYEMEFFFSPLATKKSYSQLTPQSIHFTIK